VSDVQVTGEQRSQYSSNALSGYRREGGNENESVERMESRNLMPDGNRIRRSEHAQTRKRRHQSQPTRHLLSTETGRGRFQGIDCPEGLYREEPGLSVPGETIRNRSSEMVFHNIVDPQLWPSSYPNSYTVELLNSRMENLHGESGFCVIRSRSQSRAACVSSSPIAALAGLAMVVR